MQARIAALASRSELWLESFAVKPYAVPLLFAVAFIEASLFPVPPDIPFIALATARLESTIRYTLVCIAGSCFGAVAGYLLGSWLYDSIGVGILQSFGFQGHFEALLLTYHENAVAALVGAGFTNIPFLVFTWAAGFRHTVDPVLFFVAVLAGRTLRFGLIGALFFFFGPSVVPLIKRYILFISFAFLILFILVWIFFRGSI